MTKIEGFYGSKGHLIVTLMGSIFAAYLSSSLHLTFGTICFVISTLFKKVRLVIGISLGIVFAFYILSIIGSLSKSFNFIKHFNFFSFVDNNAVFIDKSISEINILIMVITITISFILGNLVYKRKKLLSR